MISDIIDERSLGALLSLSGRVPEAAPREMANNRAFVVRFNAQESELFDDYRLRKSGTRRSPILLYFCTSTDDGRRSSLPASVEPRSGVYLSSKCVLLQFLPACLAEVCLLLSDLCAGKNFVE